MKAYERLINYARVHTASSDDTSRTPSTDRQFDLADLLADEMHALGFSGVAVDEHAYVYGYIPATPGLEDLPCVGFNAHIDTIPDFSGENVQPMIHENYDGGDIPLGDSGRVLSPKNFPDLNDCIGHTLITTDGTTVLGADDKAGVAEIMTAFERVLTENIPHGRIAACFSPDEEVGHGAALMDLDRFGADFAYTVDGQEIEEINCETFNAASADWEINGFNVHPGSAKNVLVNANIVAMEINSMLPRGDRPELTEDYEGFFHLTEMQGKVAHATMHYIIRDHDAAKFAARKDCMRHIEKLINEKYGAGTAVLTIKDCYRNMMEIMRHHAGIIVLAESAVRKCGLEPKRVPIRGGTDGAQLSFRGLPCPNIGTGGAGLHGPYEHISAENMDLAVQILLNIITGVTELR
jgi:tripeptide aminopeptidase